MQKVRHIRRFVGAGGVSFRMQGAKRAGLAKRSSMDHKDLLDLLDRNEEFRERRATLRTAWPFPVELYCERHRVEGKALDLSLNGARVRCADSPGAGQLRAGAPVSLRSLDRAYQYQEALVAGWVCWSHRSHHPDWEVGVEFEPSDVEDSWVVTTLRGLPGSLLQQQKRKLIRIACHIRVDYLTEGGVPQEGVLVNLSAGGGQLDCSAPIPQGSRVAMRSSLGDTPGQLRLVGTVIRTEETPDAKQHGVVFGELSVVQQRTLSKTLRALMRSN